MSGEVRSEAFNAIAVGLQEMSKEQRYRWMDKLFWRRLSAEIKVNRESRGWSQEELARKCGTRQPVVARWENPRKIKGITINTLTLIATAFDCALIVRFCSWGEWITTVITPIGTVASFKDDPFFKP